MTNRSLILFLCNRQLPCCCLLQIQVLPSSQWNPPSASSSFPPTTHSLNNTLNNNSQSTQPIPATASLEPPESDYSAGYTLSMGYKPSLLESTSGLLSTKGNTRMEPRMEGYNNCIEANNTPAPAQRVLWSFDV